MIDKQQIVVDLLNERLPQTKVGIIVKGVDSIDADKITASVAESTGQYIYAAAVGYPIANTDEKNNYGNTAQKSRRDTARSDIIRPWINR